jgi:hypothetical protein
VTCSATGQHSTALLCLSYIGEVLLHGPLERQGEIRLSMAWRDISANRDEETTSRDPGKRASGWIDKRRLVK